MIGIIAPAPQYKTILSYIPNTSNNAPIITNNVGEIKYYFNDDELLKCDYSIIGFSEAFRWIEYHKEKSLEIGYNGFLKGKTEFDYLKQGKLIYEFLAKQI